MIGGEGREGTMLSSEWKFRDRGLLKTSTKTSDRFLAQVAEYF